MPIDLGLQVRKSAQLAHGPQERQTGPHTERRSVHIETKRVSCSDLMLMLMWLRLPGYEGESR